MSIAHNSIALINNPVVPSSAVPLRNPRSGLVRDGDSDQNRGKGAEAEDQGGHHHKQTLVGVDPPHRKFEGQSWLAASAFGIGIPLLLAACFLSIMALQRAETAFHRKVAKLTYLSCLLATCFTIYAAVG